MFGYSHIIPWKLVPDCCEVFGAESKQLADLANRGDAGQRKKLKRRRPLFVSQIQQER